MSKTAVQPVKSGPSRKICYLRFTNKTNRRVNIVWIDFLGNAKNYGTLNPNMSSDVQTYEGHPWICEDYRLKTRLLLNRKYIFNPMQPSTGKSGKVDRYYLVQEYRYVDVNDYPIRSTKVRELVYVSLPVFSLKEISAEVIIKHIPNVADINALNLPPRLKHMLQEMHYP